jgi:uncharacterized SAM-binding protein YcdF (DUF218 family)
MDLFLLKKVLTALVLPPTGPLLLAIAGAFALRRWPRLGRVLLWTGLAVLLALSLSPVSSLLLQLANGDIAAPLRLEDAKTAQAVVILGGGVRRDAAEYGGDTLGRTTLERVRYGARVARLTGLPVLVAGGSVFGDTATEASLMRAALEQEFGVPVRWAEDRSRNTHENAQFSAAILKRDGVKRIVLVMHGFDMRRARAEFDAAGIEVVPAPTVIPTYKVTSVFDFLPSLGALQGSHYALYELLANAVRDW